MRRPRVGDLTPGLKCHEIALFLVVLRGGASAVHSLRNTDMKHGGWGKVSKAQDPGGWGVRKLRSPNYVEMITVRMGWLDM